MGNIMTDSNDSCLHYDVHNRVATLTLNRPAARHAFDAELRQRLHAAIRQAEQDDEVRVLVLTADGPVFSAGTDLKEFDATDQFPQQQLEQEYKPSLMAIAQCDKPVIAAVNGTAAGIGAAYAMACDLTIMADSASIYMAFAAIALVPDGGATWQLLHALGRRRAFELIASGGKLDAQACLAHGLANRLVPAEQLADAAQQWAESFTRQAPLAMAYAKRALSRAYEDNLDRMIDLEAGFQNYCVRSEDGKEGLAAFWEKRTPTFRGR